MEYLILRFQKKIGRSISSEITVNSWSMPLDLEQFDIFMPVKGIHRCPCDVLAAIPSLSPCSIDHRFNSQI